MKNEMDRSLEKALERLKAKGDYGHVHSDRCIREICRVLTPDEETIMEIKQSHFRNITPERLIATNKRLIIVRPSFFGHYFGFDLFHHTNISFVPYRQLISVVMSKGKLLSTVHMRIHGYMDTDSILRKEGEIEGVRTEIATKFTMFIDDVIENRGRDDEGLISSNNISSERNSEGAINLENAKSVVEQNGTEFVWLGFEPVVEVAATLGVPKERISKFDMSDVTEMLPEYLKRYDGCVFVCYDGITSNHLIKHLKKEHGIDAYNLNNGILHAVRTTFEKFS